MSAAAANIATIAMVRMPGELSERPPEPLVDDAWERTGAGRSSNATKPVLSSSVMCRMTTVFAVWAYAAPVSFSHFIDYAPYNRHLIHDAFAEMVAGKIIHCGRFEQNPDRICEVVLSHCQLASALGTPNKEASTTAGLKTVQHSFVDT